MFNTKQAVSEIHQGTLDKVIRELFSSESIHLPLISLLSNIRKEVDLVNPSSGGFLEIDVWVPSLNICFEFQDPYHYGVFWSTNYTLEFVQSKDATKDLLLKQRGHTLIEVPFWWDGDSASLGATIHFNRQDLLSSPLYATSSPIPLLPPLSALNSLIPDVGMLMLATFPGPGDAKAISPKNYWWLGEKYDGIRFCWHPSHKLFRHGRSLSLPSDLFDLSHGSDARGSRSIARSSWGTPSDGDGTHGDGDGTHGSGESLNYHHHNHVSSTSSVSDLFYDGEMWFGRGNFSEAIKLAGSLEASNWTLLRNVLFDVVSHAVSFEERYSSLLHNLLADHPVNVLAPRIQCTHKDVLVRMSSAVTETGGEGVILRKNMSFYQLGKSTSLLKLKTSRGDTEGLVVGSKGDTLTLKLPNRTQIELKVPRGDHERDVFPKRGDIVTFAYDHMNLGVPHNPRFIRVRADVAWKEVLLTAPSKSLNEHSLTALNQTSHRRNKMKEVGRNMLEKFALSKNMDPHLPSTWYSFTRLGDLVHDKGVQRLLWSFHNSYINMIRSYFPDLNLDPTKFTVIPRSYWLLNVGERRRAFMQYAKLKGFDPFVAENWYKQSRSDLKDGKGIDTIILHYRSVRATISNLFPEIGIGNQHFRKRHFWSEHVNRKEFLDGYAKAHSFDPLVARNWYSLRLHSLMRMGCSSAALKGWGDYKQFILHTYPNIGLDVSLFPIETRRYWSKMENRRNFFISVARTHGLDPLLPATWYHFRRNMLTANKKIQSLLNYYPKKDPKKAIIDAFPDLGLKEELFNRRIQM